MSRTRIGVMVSGQGRGTNLQAIIDACSDGRIPAEVALVIGVTDEAPAMDRARNHGIPAVVLSPKTFETVEDYDQAVLDALKGHGVDLVCLAGYMRKLGKTVLDPYKNAVMNTHPALIPMFCGKGMYGHHVHESAIAYGVKVSGCTVHFVDGEYDTGPIILQTVVPVREDDTPDTLAARILPEEHRTYVEAIRLFAEGRLRVEGRRVNIA